MGPEDLFYPYSSVDRSDSFIPKLLSVLSSYIFPLSGRTSFFGKDGTQRIGAEIERRNLI